MEFKVFWIILICCAHSAGALTLTELKCKEELTLNSAPVSCYALGEPAIEAQRLLNRRCKMAAEKIKNLEILLSLVKSTGLSSECRSSLVKRGKILAYKMSDTEPQLAFQFLRLVSKL